MNCPLIGRMAVAEAIVDVTSSAIGPNRNTATLKDNTRAVAHRRPGEWGGVP